MADSDPVVRPPPLERLPRGPILRDILKSSVDVALLDEYLNIIAGQRGHENGPRILLQTCAEVGNDLFVEALLRRGADVDAYQKSSLPALHSAAKGDHTGLLTCYWPTRRKSIWLTPKGGLL